MIHLPFPVSVDAAWRNVPGHGRVKTKRYLAWEKEAGVEILRQRPIQPILGPFHLAIMATRPELKRKRDISNLIKLPEDLLVAFNIIEDDSFAQSVTIRWTDAVEAPVVGVQI